MDRERWIRLERISFDASELPPEARGAFLDEACAGDDALRREVDRLLQHLDAAPDFLEQPAADLRSLETDPDAGAEDGAPETPERIGPYRIIRILGRGGMGAVYLAEREAEDVRQLVALKVIRRGMDTDEILERFRLERRILASLRHPNIAQLIDAAATDDGRPYFVMEYVEGQPITEYCTARVPALRDRIRLMQAVCAAVQHAHQNFVVHRDLKPRNIFVTADGTPKLLDFGIGKVLTDDRLGPAVSTRAEARLLTPEYATPEQLDGGLVTTATDVYGLGLLLYEVLAGHHPYLTGGESLTEIERAVLTAEPRAPSLAAGRRDLAGDLDTIVLKALRKEPERRYVSAAELADDLQRHLDGLPVRARPDTIGYRARKFVTRNAWPVAAGTVAFLGLAATSAVTIVQSRRVAAEAARATRERDQALEVRGFLLEMFGATGANQAVGDTITARGLLDLQARQVDEAYRYRPALRADMLEVLADGYDRLGIYQPAESLARLALDQRRYVDPDGPDVAATLNLLGWIVHERGRSAEAEPLVLEAVARRRADLPHSEQELSRSLNDLGVIYNATNRYAAAESVLVEALEIRRRRQGDAHRVVGITANNLAASYYFQRKLDQAIATQQLALESLRQSVGEDHQRTIVALGNLAAFRLASGDLAGAEREYRDLLERQTRLQGPDHPVTARVRLSLGSAISDRAAFTHSDSAFDSAEDLLRSAVNSFEKTLGPDHIQVATAMGRLATLRIARGEWDDAVRILERAVAIVRRQPTGNAQLLKQAEARLAAVRQSRDSVARAKTGG